MDEHYPAESRLFIDGQWRVAVAGEVLPIFNPATDQQLGIVAHARVADLQLAVEAAQRGFALWRRRPPMERAQIMRKASTLLRERSVAIGRLLSQEQGKILNEARGEVERSADNNDWLAGEAERIYGRTIAGRGANVTQTVQQDPIGIVAAFTPWNFPMLQLVRKIAPAVAAGCAIVVKGPEETPAVCCELIRAYEDAGIPPGVINLVFGTPAEISAYLIQHPAIRKVSFTGSTAVGKQLAALAGQYMKVMTMELGGHAPVLVFADADVEAAAHSLCGNKFRNAGQSCISPTRMLVQEPAYKRFVAAFVERAKHITVGPGLDPASTMGSLANSRRLTAVVKLVDDAVSKGAGLRLGGKRIGTVGNFFEPTVLADAPLNARAMNEEPFGPLALVRPFHSLDDAITEANRLPYGLAAYAFTSSISTARAVAAGVESGMVSINHFGLVNPESPFGGVKDSGYGFEGGSEAIDAYLQTRFVTMADL